MTVRIAIEPLRRIRIEATPSPDEVCGLLFGTADTIEAVQACRNVASDPRRRFEIDPAALLRAYRAARTGGPALLGCYHSHPGGEAMPSPCDAVAAAADGWLWLIVTSETQNLFRAVPDGAIHGRFDHVTLLIG